MLNVFICDDNEMQLKYFRKFIEDAIVIGDYDMKVTLTSTNPNDILEYVKTHEAHGLYFIDVKLNSTLNGFKLVEYIRNYDQRAFVVFFTAEEKDYHLSLRYFCELLDYIIKEFQFDKQIEMKSRISRCLRIAYERSIVKEKKVESEKNLVLLELKRNKNTTVDLNDIVWIEKDQENSNKVNINGCNNVKQIISTLKEVLNQLNDRFIQIGKFYIINKERVYDYDISQKLITVKGNKDDSSPVTFKVSHKVMRKFLKTMYPTRNEKIKNKVKKSNMKIIQKEEI